MATADRQRQYKQGINVEESRRRREDTTIQIRKTKKEDRMNQRRKMTRPHESTEVLIEQSIQTQLSQLPDILTGITSGVVETQLQALIQLRRILAIEHQPPIQAVVDTGIIPTLVLFLQADADPRLQFEASWALTNVSSGTSEHTKIVVESGAVVHFTRLLSSPNDDVREQAVWALGNIAGDSPYCRDLVLETGALEPLCCILNMNVPLGMTQNAVWTVSNCCRGKPPPAFHTVQAALPAFAQLLFMQDSEVLVDACWGLSYLSDGCTVKIQAVIESGVVPRLIDLLLYPSPAVVTPALRTLGNIVTGDMTQTQVVLDFNALPTLTRLLTSPKNVIRKEACWAISNITAGNEHQIQAVFNADIIPPLLEVLSNDAFEIRKEAMWAIANSTVGGNIVQIYYLISQGVVLPMVDMLNVADVKCILIALEGLSNVLRCGERMGVEDGSGVNLVVTVVEEADGIAKLTHLQSHENESIYNKAMAILEKYFEAEEEEDGSVAPNVDATRFQFGMDTPEQGSVFNFAPPPS